MKKWTIRILVGVVVIFAGLVALGYNQEIKAKAFVESKGGTQVVVLGGSPRILCAGGIGLAVAYKMDGEDGMSGVCTGLFTDAYLGVIK